MNRIQTSKMRQQRPRKVNPKRWNGTLARSNNGDFYDMIGIHEERGFVLAFRSCNCAPEQFKAFLNGQRVDISDPGKYGVILISEGPQKIIDMFKRRYREKRRPRSSSTSYGFYIKGNPRSCLAIDFRGRSDDLQSRLVAYKQTKAHLAKNNWRYREAQTATLDGMGYVESIKDSYVEADPARPAIIHVH